MEVYNKSLDKVFAQEGSSKEGLTTSQARERLAKNGQNKLAEVKKKSFLLLFLAQFVNAMIIILLAAASLSAVLGHFLDAIIILAVVIANSLLGAIQESKAEKTIEALAKMSAATSKVRRDGQVVVIPSEDIVTGDIIILEAGDNVPCDIRLIETHSLQIEEAALTGESVPSEKCAEVILEENVALGDRKNMAFMGTNVSYGRGVGIAIGTGMNTQMGKIADILISTKEDATPLQKQMDKIGKFISIVVLIVCVAMFGVRMLYTIGKEITAEFLLENFMTSVSLAVAAIPEGLSAVITLVMTMGVTRLSKNNAIIRKLPSIETLGCAEIICSDKTGTLTQNKMTVVEIFTLDDKKDQNGQPLSFDELTRAAVLCNDSTIDGKKVLGDPTETALVSYALAQGLDAGKIMSENRRVGEVPFDSVRKLMSTVNVAKDGNKRLYIKGAADELVSKCNKYLKDGEILPLDEAAVQTILDKNKSMAENALRVLGFAMRQKKHDEADKDDEIALVFVGLMGMIDPVRPEVKAAVAKCKTAGVTPIMITGDHLITAIAIGKEIGIINSDDEAITGREIDAMSDKEFDEKLDKFKVYARVSPENKVRIVKFWKARGKICAMTGDGVNDAPALKTSNIGVGMGITGTAVTKSVADMVLADDNFATIIVAVEEGRKIYDNLKKTIQFLLSTNLCEVLSLFVATLLGFTILKPVQILWVNLVTDTVPALGLGIEKGEGNIMTRSPRDPKKSVFADGLGVRLVYQSVIMTGLVLASFFIGYYMLADSCPEVGMTMAFITLSFVQIFHAFNLKCSKSTIFSKDTLGNKVLFYGAAGTIIMTLILVYTPNINTVFGLVSLPPTDILIALALSVSIIPIVEFVKLIQRKLAR